MGHVLSEEECEGFEHGFLTADLVQKYAPAGEYSVFLCGPEAMYRFVLPEVEKPKLPRRRVRCEAMGGPRPSGRRRAAECRDRVFRVTVRQGALEQTVPAENEGRRRADVDHGYIHPCCTFTLSDLTIEVPGEYLG